jgi:hypothetical protein
MKRFGSMPRFDRDARPGEEFPFVVTASDIGERDDPEHCVFARCAKRVMHSDNAWFGRSTAYIEINGEVVRFLYTPAMASAIRDFDDTGKMKPGTYRVLVPRPSQRIDTKRERHRLNPKREVAKPGSKANARERGAWHAPRGWGRGVTPNGDVSNGR